MSGLILVLAVLVGAGHLDGAIVQWDVASGGNGHWYEAVYVGPSGISFSDAKDAAVAKGGHLATMGSAAENSFAYDLVSDDQFWMLNHAGDGTGPWLGGYQLPGAAQTDEDWTWVTGEPWTYSNWGLLEPNDGSTTDYIENGGEDYLHFWAYRSLKDSTWNDAGARNKMRGYVAEYPPLPIPEPSTIALLAVCLAVAIAKHYRICCCISRRNGSRASQAIR